MHSNFITPPDYVETVLIVNIADENVEQVQAAVAATNRPHNIYFYNDAMNNPEWLMLVRSKADTVLDAEIANPVEYFNK